MFIINTLIIISLCSIVLFSLAYPHQIINGQTPPTESNPTSNLTESNANATLQIQWEVYTNDRFGFTVDYPKSWTIEEKQNRFERGAELTIESPTFPQEGSGYFILNPPLRSPTNNISELTDFAVDTILNNVDIGSERRLIENTNITKYKTGQEPVGAFTFVEDSKNIDATAEEPIPYVAMEVVIAIHNGYSFDFWFGAHPMDLDSPGMTEIREHMFNSIKWLK